MRAQPEDDIQEEEPSAAPLTAEEVRRLRERQPPLSAWTVVGAQLGVGSLAAVAAGVFSGSREVGWSVAYGALAVAVPAAVFARALARRAAAGARGAGFLVWEFVKIALTVALLFAAPRLVPGLNWLGLLGGVIVATKMYWVALAALRRSRRTGN
jgi:ATP synthase protein I